MISAKTPGIEDQIIILLNIHGVSEAGIHQGNEKLVGIF
jgi:hypothetical protein